MVVLDNAPFHRSRGFKEGRERWRGRGLEEVYLPRYSPQYNPVETVWRRVKGWLLPRRYYGSVEELRRAVEEALRKLRERLEKEVGKSLCMATYPHSAPLPPSRRISGWQRLPTCRCTTSATWAWWPASWTASDWYPWWTGG